MLATISLMAIIEIARGNAVTMFTQGDSNSPLSHVQGFEHGATQYSTAGLAKGQAQNEMPIPRNDCRTFLPRITLNKSILLAGDQARGGFGFERRVLERLNLRPQIVNHTVTTM
jgi:hypothetical protein